MKFFAWCRITTAIVSRSILLVVSVWTLLRWSYLMAYWSHSAISEEEYVSAYGSAFGFALIQVIGFCILWAAVETTWDTFWPKLKKWHEEEVGELYEKKKKKDLGPEKERIIKKLISA